MGILISLQHHRSIVGNAIAPDVSKCIFLTSLHTVIAMGADVCGSAMASQMQKLRIRQCLTHNNKSKFGHTDAKGIVSGITHNLWELKTLSYMQSGVMMSN